MKKSIIALTLVSLISCSAFASADENKKPTTTTSSSTKKDGPSILTWIPPIRL